MWEVGRGGFPAKCSPFCRSVHAGSLLLAAAALSYVYLLQLQLLTIPACQLPPPRTSKKNNLQAMQKHKSKDTSRGPCQLHKTFRRSYRRLCFGVTHLAFLGSYY